jgi:hypothetical protein
MDRPPDPLWREHPARSRRRVLAISAVVVAAYVGYVSVNTPGSCSAPGGGPCGADAAVVAIRVSPRPPLPLPACLRRERAFYQAGDGLIRRACRPGRADWYHAVVTYRGTTDTWVGCAVTGYDAGGHRLWPRPWGIPLIPMVPSPVGAVQRMHHGQTITVDYHLPGIRQGGPPGPVARYVGRCQTYPAAPS